MILDKGKISNLQFIFLFIGYILGSSLLLSVSEYKSMPNTWIVVLVALLIGLMLVFIFSSLARKFKTQSLIEINNIVYGKIIGTFISLLYFSYLFILTSLDVRFFGDFFVSLIMPDTPIIIFGIMITFVAAVAVKKGLEVIARVSSILVILTIIEIITTSFLLITEINPSNFLPILDISLNDFMVSTNFLAFALFGETILFMLVFPHLDKKSSRYKCSFIPLLIAAGIIEFVALRTTSIFGESGALYTYSAYESIRLINIGKIFTRLELFLFISIIFSNFIKLTLLYYCLVLTVAKILRLNSYTHLVYPLGIIIVCFSTIIFEYYGEQMNFGMIAFPIVAFPLHLVIPLLSLVISKFRKL